MKSEKTNRTTNGDFANDIANRLAKFAADIIRLIDTLPESRSAKLVADQVLRSATSTGANYAEARSGHTQKEFLYRLSLVVKELRESLHWLRVISAAGWADDSIQEVCDEGLSLLKMLAASKATMEGRRK